MNELQFFHFHKECHRHDTCFYPEENQIPFTVAYSINPEFLKYAFAFVHPKEKFFIKKIGRRIATENYLGKKFYIKSQKEVVKQLINFVNEYGNIFNPYHESIICNNLCIEDFNRKWLHEFFISEVYSIKKNNF